MTDKNKIFDEQYTTGSTTKGEAQKSSSQSSPIPEIKIEDRRYGNGKPKRVVIRAKLTDD